MRTTRLRVKLRDVEPPVTRLLDVPAAALLPEVHDLLQAAIGWTDSHLHQFVTEAARYGAPDVDAMDDERDETGVALRSLPARFTYLYDFGDGWEHEVEVLGTGGERPGVVDGEGACPPEDVGGPPGYEELLAVLADPSDPGHDHLARWAGSWSPMFDRPAADELVRRTAGEVPATVRALLEVISDGVQLTPGGRLPRALVRRLQERYPDWHPLGRPASSEEDLPPLATLHDLLRGVGLLRLSKGVLVATRAASDEQATIRRLRSWFGPTQGFTSIIVGYCLALLAADGPSAPAGLAERLTDLLGTGWVTSRGERVDAGVVRRALYDLEPALVGLDLVLAGTEVWVAGPSARSFLPRATALAQEWSAQR